MGDIDRLLAEQHIREYDMRLHHVDELLEHVEKKLSQTPEEAETSAQLEKLKEERDRLASWLYETKQKPIENWREDEIRAAGPMGIWDAIAQQIEKLVERIER
ncbi:MAG: hypothetical protein A2061_07620 [Gallionellales bacterium GWA2_59_43]|nr:MAG: hypothetical protein A2061_07620 [Gallionellales bacterium GWA2_59_43]